MRIEVTAAHIAIGVKAGCWDCPVALAIKDATGDEWHVFGGAIRLEGEGRGLRLPAAARRWIVEYDRTGTGEPFSFDMPIRRKPCSSH